MRVDQQGTLPCPGPKTPTRFAGVRSVLADVQPVAPRGPLAKDALDWWRRPSAPPVSGGFDILDHPTWAAGVYFIRRCGPGEFDYRLAGEDVIKLVGRNDARQRFASASGDFYVRDLADYLESVAESRRPWICWGTSIQPDGERIRFESIDMPMLNDARTAVDSIIGVMSPINDARSPDWPATTEVRPALLAGA